MAAKVINAPLPSSSPTRTRRSRSRSRSIIIRSRSRSKSRQQAQAAQQQPQSPKKKKTTTQKKLLNVNVQILSVAGVHIEDTSNTKKSSFLRKSTTTEPSTDNNTDNSATKSRGRSRSRTRSLSRSRSKSRGRRSLSRNRRSSSLASPTRGRSTRRVKIAPESDPTAITIVSSFERTSTFIQGGKKVGPKKITTSCISLPFNPADNEGESENKNSSQVIPWGDQSKSSFTFQRYFRHESSTTSTTKSFDPLGINSKQQRYQPIICPIQLSLSRNGKMYQLGTASIYISGEEAGISSMNVPITTINSTTASPFKKSNNNNVAMKSIKGERNLKYGISTKATLRIVVTVSDPSSTLERISKALSFDGKQQQEEENKKVVRIKEPTFLEFLCCMG